MTMKDLKVLVTTFLIAVVFFSSIMLYRANVIDPQLDEAYLEVYGMEDWDDED